MINECMYKCLSSWLRGHGLRFILLPDISPIYVCGRHALIITQEYIDRP